MSRRSYRFMVRAAFVLSAASLVAGCGGSDDVGSIRAVSETTSDVGAASPTTQASVATTAVTAVTTTAVTPTTEIPAVQRPKYFPDVVMSARVVVEPGRGSLWAESGRGTIEFVGGSCYLNEEGLVVQFGENDYESDYFGLYAPFSQDGTYQIQVGAVGGAGILKNDGEMNFSHSAPHEFDGPLTVVLEAGRTRGSGASGTMTRDDLGIEFTFECT